MDANNCKKVLVTGAAGFVGKHLVKKLLQNGYDVCVFIRKEEDADFFYALGVQKVYQGDLRYNCPELKQAFFENHFDSVVHLAALIKASWADFERVNVMGTKYIMELSRSEQLSHFVFTSTDFVLFTTENDYKKSKLMSEELLHQSNLNYTILRPSPIYGPGDSKNVASLINMIKKFPILPAPSYIMYPVYVEDVADAIVKTLASPNVIKKEYNIPGAPAMTFREMMTIIRDTLKRKCLLVPVPNALFAFLVKIQEVILPTPILNYYQVEKWSMNKPISAEDAKRDFNFVQTPFDVGIKKTINNVVK